MLYLLNLITSILLYVLLVVLDGIHLGRRENSVLSRVSGEIFKGRVRTCMVFVLAYLYALFSCVMYFGIAEASGLAFVLLTGFGGAVGVVGEIVARDRRSSVRLEGPGFYTSHIDYQFARGNTAKLKHAIDALTQEAAVEPDARAALDALILRQDSLGDFVRKALHYEQKD